MLTFNVLKFIFNRAEKKFGIEQFFCYFCSSLPEFYVEARYKKI